MLSNHCIITIFTLLAVCLEVKGQSALQVMLTSDVTTHPNLRLINSNKCGRIFDRPFGGAVGNKTLLFDFPWMVLLGYQTSTGGSFFCAGSLINERYVLTAAVCITNSSRLRLTSVRLGEHDTTTDPDCDESMGKMVCSRHMNIGIEETHIHPQYAKRYKRDNGIALIRLAKSVKLDTDSILPVCLPVGIPYKNMDGEMLTMTGWGEYMSGLNPRLGKQEVPVVPILQCAVSYKNLSYVAIKIPLDGSVVCAGSNGQGPCFGDSGAPLQGIAQLNAEPRYVQYGIVDFGPALCRSSIPDVYTNVAHHMKWILDTIRPSLCQC